MCQQAATVKHRVYQPPNHLYELKTAGLTGPAAYEQSNTTTVKYILFE